MAKGPYRGGAPSAPVEPAHEEGIVGELVQQFADPLAFYRELVQNSIDAGASSIGVTLAWEPSDEKLALAQARPTTGGCASAEREPGGEAPQKDGAGTLLVSVRDDGCGMGRSVLEEQLTVLFRSGKEGVAGKIGKFGVGFVSVLAVEPSLVSVRTSEGRGEQWTLELSPDHTYEIFRSEGSGARGTSVTLHVPVRRDALERFVEGSERALSSWCAHVEIPLRFVAHVAGSGTPMAERRIDGPLAVDAWLSVDASDRGTRVVAGLPRDGQPRLAFYNRGLLLYETTQDVLGAVAVKIKDARLEHTLSRDNVRRDAHYERALRFARKVIDERLTGHARTVLKELAEGRRSEPPIDRVLAAVESAGLPIALRELSFPLMFEEKSQRAAPAAWLRRADCYVATEPTPLGEAVAAAGGVVLDLRVADSPEAYRACLSSMAGRALELVDGALMRATAFEHEGSDEALLEVTREVLSEVARAPSDLRLVRIEGALRGAVVGVTGSGALPALLTREEARRDPFRLLARPPLWLDVEAPLVQAARASAKRDPSLAGALLARGILLHHGALDEACDEAWLAACAARLAGERS